jgi:acyl-CoA thioester hydrolase
MTDTSLPQSDLRINGNARGWSHSLEFRATYHETDGQRRVHHANYLNYFERGRVEMLRTAGIRYKDLEDEGLLLVVAEMSIRYQQAAEFDDLLTLTTRVTGVRKVRISHHYAVHRGSELIVDADSIIACVDFQGRPRRLPSVIIDAVEAARTRLGPEG